MISRRNFFALASGLLVPYEPERVYSFASPVVLLPCPWAIAGYNASAIAELRNISENLRRVMAANPKPYGGSWASP